MRASYYSVMIENWIFRESYFHFESNLIIYRQVKLHNIGARLVGVDQFGNKYYEKLEGVMYG